MTTIVYSEGVLAADSLMAMGTEPCSGDMDKIYENHTTAIGFAGHVSQCLKIVKWVLEDDSDPEAKPDLSVYDEVCYSVIIIDKATLECWTLEGEELDRIPAKSPVAIGSGGSAAIGALRVLEHLKRPLDAKLAVKIAMKCDVYTGKKVKSINLNKKSKKKSKK